MEQIDRFPANGFFRGTRTIVLRSLPAGARLTSFRLRITPLSETGAIGPALEIIDFDNSAAAGTVIGTDPENPARETGISRLQGGGAMPWSEVDLGGFRTLASVDGTSLDNKILQVDLGGLFADVGDTGTVPAQGGVFVLGAGANDLPGLRVQRLRLSTAVAAAQPVITSLALRAVASNLTLSIGRQPAAWALPGELTAVAETIDLTDLAQAALDEAETEGGFALLPLHLKTDTTAQLGIEVISEVRETASGLPAGLDESTLDYAHDGTSEAGDDLLMIPVPPGMEVDPNGTRIAIDGTFEGSEISLGSIIDRAPAGALALAVGDAAAQPVAIEKECVLDAVDVLLSTQARAAEVKLDLRQDFDGKPGDISLLSQPATGIFGVSAHGGPRWLSAALGQTVTLPPGSGPVWLVAEAVSEPVAWHLNAETGGGAGAQMQTSDNGGLSWRPARVAGLDGALAGQSRFRRASPVFRVPVTAEIGRDAEAEVLALDRFQPLGRVEFALASDEVARAANGILSAREAAACPRGEQLANGGFADRGQGDIYRPEDWTVSGGNVGRQAFPVQTEDGALAVTLVRLGNVEGGPQSMSQILSVSAGCTYALSFRGFAPVPGPVIELNWRQAGCGLSRTDILEPPPLWAEILDGGAVAFTPSSIQLRAVLSRRLEVSAPLDAEQLEIRLRAPAGQRLYIDAVALTGGSGGLLNPDFTDIDPVAQPVATVAGWSVTPAPTVENPIVTLDIGSGGLRVVNIDPAGQTALLTQKVAVTAGAPFAAALEAHANAGQAGFAVRWTTPDGADAATPLAATLVGDGTGITRLRGTVPEIATGAELQIQLAAGADVTLVAASAQTEAPQAVPVSFLSEAPGRLAVRDFTVAFRPRPQASLPPPPAAPCLPSPADTAPADICECDPCCGKGKDADQAGPATTVQPVGLPPATVVVRPATQPGLEIATLLPRESATASILSRAREVSFLRPLGFGGLRAAAEIASAPDVSPAAANLPVTEINGIGQGREAMLAEVGVSTVAEVANLPAPELARVLNIRSELAESLILQARDMTLAGSDRPAG